MDRTPPSTSLTCVRAQGSEGKYWSAVGGVEGGYGDGKVVCACPAPEAFGDSRSDGAERVWCRATVGRDAAAVGQQFAGVLEQDHSVAEQAPALFREGGEA